MASVPQDVLSAARAGDVDAVTAWLDATPRDLNGYGPTGLALGEPRNRTLLQAICAERPPNAGHVELLRILFSRGADANIAPGLHEFPTPLHYTCGCSYGGGFDLSHTLAATLLESGARPNARTDAESTPLCWAVTTLTAKSFAPGQSTQAALKTVKVLLWHGASLDDVSPRRRFGIACDGSIEDYMKIRADKKGIAHWDQHCFECKDIFAGVRAFGSYKAYVRSGHKELLRLRSLLVRGRAQVRRGRTRRSRPQADGALFERIARLPNGAAWNVLSYWRRAD